MSESLAERTVPAATITTACPHCRKPFEASVDLAQPPRLQGAKCSHCRLFVPARHIEADADAHREHVDDAAASVPVHVNRAGDPDAGGATSSTGGGYRRSR